MDRKNDVVAHVGCIKIINKMILVESFGCF